MTDKKKIPIGISEFSKLRNNGFYYIDKTMLVAELLSNSSEVTLITRPRRFGKTLNMTMLREFFSMDVDSKEIFAGLKIIETKYASEMNKYPVIFFSFKDAKGSKADIITVVKSELKREIGKYLFLLDQLKGFDKRTFEDIIEKLQNSSSDDLSLLGGAIYFLCQIVFEHHKSRPILLIDE